MPTKSGFVREGSWAKTVLSLVFARAVSGTSNRLEISPHVNPALTCAIKNSSRRLTSSTEVLVLPAQNERKGDTHTRDQC